MWNYVSGGCIMKREDVRIYSISVLSEQCPLSIGVWLVIGGFVYVVNIITFTH